MEKDSCNNRVWNVDKNYGQCYICNSQEEIEAMIHTPKRIFFLLKCGHQTQINIEGLEQSSYEMGIPRKLEIFKGE